MCRNPLEGMALRVMTITLLSERVHCSKGNNDWPKTLVLKAELATVLHLLTVMQVVMMTESNKRRVEKETMMPKKEDEEEDEEEKGDP